MPALSTCHTLGLMNEINKSRVEKSGVNEGMEHTHIHKERAGMGHGKFQQTSTGNTSKHTIATDKQFELHSYSRRWKKNIYTQTCKEKARSAGIGIRAAMKNAVTLLMEVKATLAPVLFRHSPVRS